MRIVITAGMFLQATGREAIRRMVAGISHCRPDALIVAGDIGGPLRVYEEGLSQLLLLDCAVGVVAGRQDLAPLEGETCRSLYDETLPELVEEFGYAWLDGTTPLVLDRIGVAGSIAWNPMEPSRENPHPDPIEEALGQCLRPDECVARLEQQLSALDANPQVEDVLVVTSIPVFENQRDPVRGPWSLNATAGALVERQPKVQWVVSGLGDAEIHGETERNGLASIATAVVGSRPYRPRYLILDTE